MKAAAITSLRLQQQQVGTGKYTQVKDLVSWMGALQAQDDAMCKWAVGTRIGDPSLKKIESALDRGEIFRTHVLRPTWHLVAANDIHWMLELTAPQIKRLVTTRHKELELTPAVLTKSRKLLEKKLADQPYMTRNDLQVAYTAVGIATNENRLSHLLFWAELESLLASGPLHNGKHTYALLDQRVKKKRLLKREEALCELAYRYFSSHGPASIADFCWWSGLNLGDARLGLEGVKQQLASEKTGDTVYWMANNLGKAKPLKNSVFFLPSYDEYLISYRDRSAALEKQHQANALSTNGIFFPIIVINGQAAGTWKRSFKKEEVLVETAFFAPPAAGLKAAIKKAAGAYADFMGKKLVMK